MPTLHGFIERLLETSKHGLELYEGETESTFIATAWNGLLYDLHEEALSQC